MAEASLPRARNVEIAKARVGVDVGGGAAVDALRYLEPHAGVRLQGLPDQIELGPGRYPRAHASILFIPTRGLRAALRSSLPPDQAGSGSRDLSEIGPKHRIA